MSSEGKGELITCSRVKARCWAGTGMQDTTKAMAAIALRLATLNAISAHLSPADQAFQPSFATLDLPVV